jgi:hypothetical protein
MLDEGFNFSVVRKIVICIKILPRRPFTAEGRVKVHHLVFRLPRLLTLSSGYSD